MTARLRLVAANGRRLAADLPAEPARTAGECPHTEALHRLARQVEQLTLLVAHLTGAVEEPTPAPARSALRVLQGGGAS
jgi:hypothetical protein